MPEKNRKPTRRRSTSVKVAVEPAHNPRHDEIAERAYFISLDEAHADDLANWLRAERELTAA